MKPLSEHEQLVARAKQQHLKNIKKRSDVDYRRRYGISISEAYDMWLSQDKACDVCGEPLPPPPSKLTHLDHSHATGAVRGILCPCCNMGLGLLKDSPKLVYSMYRYISHHRVDS